MKPTLTTMNTNKKIIKSENMKRKIYKVKVSKMVILRKVVHSEKLKYLDYKYQIFLCEILNQNLIEIKFLDVNI